MAGSQEVQGVKQAIVDLDEAHIGELVRKAVAAGSSISTRPTPANWSARPLRPVPPPRTSSRTACAPA